MIVYSISISLSNAKSIISSADGKPVIALIRENSKDPTLYDFHAATHSPFSQSQDQVRRIPRVSGSTR